LAGPKQAEGLIIKKSSIKYYISIYIAFFENMVLSKRFQERCMLILHPMRKKRLQKKTEQIFMGKQQQQQKEYGFVVVSLDESFFFMIIS
jgi:hypothetical protein